VTGQAVISGPERQFMTAKRVWVALAVAAVVALVVVLIIVYGGGGGGSDGGY